MTEKSRATAPASKPAPHPTPETAEYWAAANERRLVLHHCTDCDLSLAPMVRRCPNCGGRLTWRQSSGQATLASYVIAHRPAPGWEDETPYVIALVDLAEGPRLMTSLVGVEPTPAALELDAPYQVEFEQRGPDGAQLVPVFAPVDR